MATWRWFVVLVLPLWFAATSSGGLLASDPAGIVGFTGSVAFNSAVGSLSVDLDYAVFEPGDYTGTDPSGGSEFVYAYQAFVNSGNLESVTVGLLAGHGASNDTAELSGGTVPFLTSILADSFVADFVPDLTGGGNSSIFLFTSPNAPTFVAASVAGGGVGDQQTAPSPLPEPVTGAVLLAGAMLILFKRTGSGYDLCLKTRG